MKKRYILFALQLMLITNSQIIFAQSNIPTLKAQLRLPNADSSQLYYLLSKEYSVINVDSCFDYLKTALAIAERRNNAFGVAQAMYGMGFTYLFYKRDDAKAVEWLNKAIVVGKKNNDNLNLARSYDCLGLAAHYQNSNVFADSNQIGLVIRNLVSNSLKFTHIGGKVVLESHFTEGGKTELKIVDNGIGMSETLYNQLFKIQDRASRNGTASEKGQGLGLILVKEMVEANGGTLHIQSAENQGTMIRIVL